MLRRLYLACATYTALGLASGLFYRELTRSHEFTGRTQLAFAHTHLLALGTLLFAIVLLLERQFELSRYRSFAWFFPVYNAGLAITTVMLMVKGSLQVLGSPSATSPALAGISGTGHIVLTVGFTLLMVALGKAVGQAQRPAQSPGSATEGLRIGSGA